MQLINSHLADKVKLAILFAKHRFIFVVKFRNNNQLSIVIKSILKCFGYGYSALVRWVAIPRSFNIPVNYITKAKIILKAAYLYP